MPEVQVSFQLPSYLYLVPGEYDTGTAGERLEVVAPVLVPGPVPRTGVCARSNHPDTSNGEEIDQYKSNDANRILQQTNRLLRWYRAATRRADAIEVTRAQASPFHFSIVTGSHNPGWVTPIRYDDVQNVPVALSTEELSNQVRVGFASGGEPEVGQQLLLNAEHALRQARFSEAVLSCWGAIDSVFSRKYNDLLGAALAGEWTPAREFFTGVDLGLRHKMTAMMHLIVRRSLFREPDNFWERLSVSYNKRNSIIHRGDNANEDEARQAIAVAHQVVTIMASLTVPAPAPPPAPPAPPAPPKAAKPKKKGK